MEELNNREQVITGLVRTAVQGFFAYLVVQFSDMFDTLNIDTAEILSIGTLVASIAVSVVLGLYWLILTVVQQRWGTNPIVSIVLGFLMGGRTTPSYLKNLELVDDGVVA